MSLLMVMLPGPHFLFFSLGSKLPFPLFTLPLSQDSSVVTFPRLPKTPFVTCSQFACTRGRESCDSGSPPAVLLHQQAKVFQVPPTQTHSSPLPPITTFPVVTLSATQTKLFNHTSKLSLVYVLAPSKTKQNKI